MSVTPIMDIRAWAYSMHERLGGVPNFPSYNELYKAHYHDYDSEVVPGRADFHKNLSERSAIHDRYMALRREWWEIENKDGN